MESWRRLVFGVTAERHFAGEMGWILLSGSGRAANVFLAALAAGLQLLGLAGRVDATAPSCGAAAAVEGAAARRKNWMQAVLVPDSLEARHSAPLWCVGLREQSHRPHPPRQRSPLHRKDR